MFQFYGRKKGMTDSIQIGLTRESWGPRFWDILHTMAEQSGNQNYLITNNDEADAWAILLKTQAFVMPCQLCRKHFLEFLKISPVNKLRSIVGEERRTWLREWIWKCHDRVNKINNKDSPDISIISNLYPKKSIEKSVRELYLMFELALTMQQLKPEEIRKWKNVLSRLRILYGI
jgi:hypothetical protein